MTHLRTITTLLASFMLLTGCSDNSSLAGQAEAKQKVSSVVKSEQIELTPDAIKILLEKKLSGIEISSVEPSPKEGFYQAFYNGQILYVSSDGLFLFSGTLLGLSEDEPVNHTDAAVTAKTNELSPQRAAVISSIKEDEMVVFKAEKEEFAITVFTDVDCAYCRKLHKEVPQLNARGITVRYLAFPRAGLGSSAYDKLVSVWCSDDRMLAMNNAKLKRQFSPKTCTNPVASQYQLTREFGLSGTPALILPDGELIAGYMPFDKLHQHLKDKAQQAETAGK
jgi:thiol:disulfide interchange protein DsbC